MVVCKMKFRMVDRVIECCNLKNIKTRKAISFEEFSILKVWGRKGAFPETLILQFAVESSKLLIAASSKFKQIGMVQIFSNIHFHNVTTPGDVLTGESTIVNYGDNSYEFQFDIFATERKIADGNLLMTTIQLDSCYDTEKFILMWGEIGGKTS